METPADDPVARCLGSLLRHPEPLRDIELERALLRLQAARSDAAYLLLHRVLVLETALQALALGPAGLAPEAAAARTAAKAAPPASTHTATRTSTRSFMRDAAAVAAGVVAGQVLWQALGDDASADNASAGDAATGDAEGPDFGLEL